ncbi:hypothetical protein RM543_17745 [Roseicyclus sp. F158]|uniref:SseB protein N-terminal domain-containing protein n=1 Tax=Tropicimonas omnivorans TaxID=3075590 RepID=A0ABU3DN69_9RHOB|nr:hypothetical protein [Roseicyclus sp. F158]MDT0684522.1 hypothetical protein [Roseicyclus sp. F158]
MFMNDAFTADPHATPLLEIILTALEAKERIPDVPPASLAPQFTRDALLALTIDEVGDGWVANIAFDVPPGHPDTVGTPDAYPLPTRRDAFLAGAMIVCEIVSGSPELPFVVDADQLMVVTVRPDGTPFLMSRPFPRQLA